MSIRNYTEGNLVCSGDKVGEKSPPLPPLFLEGAQGISQILMRSPVNQPAIVVSSYFGWTKALGKESGFDSAWDAPTQALR